MRVVGFYSIELGAELRGDTGGRERRRPTLRLRRRGKVTRPGSGLPLPQNLWPDQSSRALELGVPGEKSNVKVLRAANPPQDRNPAGCFARDRDDGRGHGRCRQGKVVARHWGAGFDPGWQPFGLDLAFMDLVAAAAVWLVARQNLQR